MQAVTQEVVGGVCQSQPRQMQVNPELLDPELNLSCHAFHCPRDSVQ